MEIVRNRNELVVVIHESPSDESLRTYAELRITFRKHQCCIATFLSMCSLRLNCARKKKRFLKAYWWISVKPIRCWVRIISWWWRNVFSDVRKRFSLNKNVVQVPLISEFKFKPILMGRHFLFSYSEYISHWHVSFMIDRGVASHLQRERTHLIMAPPPHNLLHILDLKVKKWSKFWNFKIKIWDSTVRIC